MNNDCYNSCILVDDIGCYRLVVAGDGGDEQKDVEE